MAGLPADAFSPAELATANRRYSTGLLRARHASARPPVAAKPSGCLFPGPPRGMAKSRSATRSVPVRRAASAGSAPARPPASPQLFLDLAGVAGTALGGRLVLPHRNA